MLRRFNRKSKAQSTAEYAILLGLVIAAAAGMQIYVKRTLQGRVHRAVQYMAQYTANVDTCSTVRLGNTTQYEPYYVNSDFTVTRSQEADQRLDYGGAYTANEEYITTRRGGGSQRYGNVEQE